MHCKQAVFLSSIGWASLELGEYLVQVEASTEEYKPVFTFTPGPFHRNVYVVYVGRKLEGGYAEPLEKERFYDIEALVTMLQRWKIPLEGWKPDEEETSETSKQERKEAIAEMANIAQELGIYD